MSWSSVLILIGLLCIATKVLAQGPDVSAKIGILTEKVVARAGGHGVLNCSVSNLNDGQFVEWFFLNGTGSGRSLTKDCAVTDDHNNVIGLEKFIISCPPQQDPGTSLFSLRINSLSKPDNGLYQCRVRLNTEDSPVDSQNVRLVVLSPPQMLPSVSDITRSGYLGDNITMSCYAEGIPAPNVTWGRANGRPLPAGRYKILNGTSQSDETTQTIRHLVLTNLTKEDRGTYRCSADNNIRPPDELLSEISIEYAPTVRAVEADYGVAIGNQMLLWCQVDGEPLPTMTWYKLKDEPAQDWINGATIVVDDKFWESKVSILSTDPKYVIEQKVMRVGSTSTMDSTFYSLRIVTVEAGDLGVYMCRARNAHGNGWDSIRLYEVTLITSRSRAEHVHASLIVGLYALIINVFTR